GRLWVRLGVRAPDLAVAGVQILEHRRAVRIERPVDGRPVGLDDAVGTVGYGRAGLIDQRQTDPALGVRRDVLTRLRPEDRLRRSVERGGRRSPLDASRTEDP